MFYIAYKADGTTACKKQISLFRLTEVGKTKSGATLYCTPSTENDGAPYRWFYTVEGIWENKYDTVYYYSKGHKSSSLFAYADKLAQAIGISKKENIS